MSCNGTVDTFPHTYTEGDTRPKITGELAFTDISAYTVEFKLEKPDDTFVEKSTAGASPEVTITDGPNGQFEIEWSASDLVVGLEQIAQVVVKDFGRSPYITRLLH